jgi:uncharacterized repeat protein (TIGR03803 family)
MKKIIPLIYSIFLLAGLPVKAQSLELWGMTYWGGLNNAGAITNITEDSDQFALSYSFGSPTGEFPMGNLLYGKDSIFYGLTPYDGADSQGVIFSYNPMNGIYTDLYDFDSVNGSYPTGSLIQDTNGILYGMTSAGGKNNFGVIFSYNPSVDTFDILHYFDNVNGEMPLGNLLMANDTTLYGMASLGGANNEGVIFNCNPATHNFIKLYDFNDSTGMLPSGALIQDSNILYAMTPYGGANDDGVIFSFNLSDKTYTDLLDFNYTNGSNPYGSLLKASNGKLYGMTENGIDSISDGLIFSFNPDSNTYTVLNVFADSTGGNPAGSFIQGANGNLYATTQTGGTRYNGVIFSFNPDSNVYTDMYNLNGAIGSNPYGDLTETPEIITIPIPVTGIKTIINNGFSLFPNPSSGLVTIISPSIIDAIKVTDLLGRVVYISTPNQSRLSLNLNDAGMYFVTLTSGNQTATGKIIISR